MAAAVEFEDVRIPVPWGHVSGRWYGDRRRRPIVAIHGWQDNLGTWDPLIPLLPAHIGVLCLDMPGHGWSSPYPSGVVYHLVDYLQIIQRVMRQYKWQQVSLMGHSMGAIMAVIYAGTFPREVDMLITIDIVGHPIRSCERVLAEYRGTYERMLKEDALAAAEPKVEPISFTYAELEEIMVRGTRGSVEPDSCKHLLNRNIAESQVYPEKFYFTRDARLKNYVRWPNCAELNAVIARQMAIIPFLAIKAKQSEYIGEASKPEIELIQDKNPLFELHVVDGTHHINVNNARECAEFIRPFLERYRPDPAKL